MSDVARLCYQKYEENIALAALLEIHAPDDGGWIAVVRFYAALQLMNAYLVDKTNVRLQLDSAAHDHRKKALDKCPELREAPKRYRALKELSEAVRYDPGFVFDAHHREESKNLLAKVIAIVAPKLPR